jgi:hypothetical protein
MTRSLSLLIAVVLPVGLSCAPEASRSLTDEQLVEAWLDGSSSRAPIELTLAEGALSGQCDRGEHPDSDRTWSDSLVRREVVGVAAIHSSLAPTEAPLWVLGPNQHTADATGEPHLFAAAPWAGIAPITCGGEAATGQIVLLSAANPIELLDVLDRAELKARMSENVEREGLAPVTDVDISRRLCPDTAEGCAD